MQTSRREFMTSTIRQGTGVSLMAAWAAGGQVNAAEGGEGKTFADCGRWRGGRSCSVLWSL